MAKQKIMHGGTIDVLTPQEMERILHPPDDGTRGRFQGYSSLFDVVMGDFDHPEPVLLVSPPARRLRITRHPHGGDTINVTTTPSLLVASNEGRMALEVVNYGANPCFLYLTNLDDLVIGGSTPGALWLGGSGGAWDGEFAEAL